jgi:hypothetical protein
MSDGRFMGFSCVTGSTTFTVVCPSTVAIASLPWARATIAVCFSSAVGGTEKISGTWGEA